MPEMLKKRNVREGYKDGKKGWRHVSLAPERKRLKDISADELEQDSYWIHGKPGVWGAKVLHTIAQKGSPIKYKKLRRAAEAELAKDLRGYGTTGDVHDAYYSLKGVGYFGKGLPELMEEGLDKKNGIHSMSFNKLKKHANELETVMQSLNRVKGGKKLTELRELRKGANEYYDAVSTLLDRATEETKLKPKPKKAVSRSRIRKEAMRLIDANRGDLLKVAKDSRSFLESDLSDIHSTVSEHENEAIRFQEAEDFMTHDISLFKQHFMQSSSTLGSNVSKILRLDNAIAELENKEALKPREETRLRKHKKKLTGLLKEVKGEGVHLNLYSKVVHEPLPGGAIKIAAISEANMTPQARDKITRLNKQIKWGAGLGVVAAFAEGVRFVHNVVASRANEVNNALVDQNNDLVNARNNLADSHNTVTGQNEALTSQNAAQTETLSQQADRITELEHAGALEEVSPTDVPTDVPPAGPPSTTGTGPTDVPIGVPPGGTGGEGGPTDVLTDVPPGRRIPHINPKVVAKTIPEIGASVGMWTAAGVPGIQTLIAGRLLHSMRKTGAWFTGNAERNPEKVLYTRRMKKAEEKGKRGIDRQTLLQQNEKKTVKICSQLHDARAAAWPEKDKGVMWFMKEGKYIEPDK